MVTLLKEDYGQYSSTFHLLEKKELFQFTDLLEIHLLELPKVDFPKDSENSDSLRNWLLFLSGDNQTKEVLAMSDLGISKAYEELQHVSQDEIMRELAFKREKFLFEQAMRLDAAKDEGLKEGREQGENKAILGMYQAGLSVEAIMEMLKLSEARVRSAVNSKQ